MLSPKLSRLLVLATVCTVYHHQQKQRMLTFNHHDSIVLYMHDMYMYMCVVVQYMYMYLANTKKS